MNTYAFTRKVHFQRSRRCEIHQGKKPARPTGRTPRISKLMALAIHLEDMIRTGRVADQASVARIGQVTRARISQIMNLGLLAPSIQEELLFLPKTTRGYDGISTKTLQPLTRELDWARQCEMWAEIKRDLPPEVFGGEWEGVSPAAG